MEHHLVGYIQYTGVDDGRIGGGDSTAHNQTKEIGMSEREDRAREIGTRLRSLRNEQAYTQVELAARAGVSKDVVVRLESGTRLPRQGNLRKLAEALDVDIRVLTSDETTGSDEPKRVSTRRSGGMVSIGSPPRSTDRAIQHEAVERYAEDDELSRLVRFSREAAERRAQDLGTTAVREYSVAATNLEVLMERRADADLAGVGVPVSEAPVMDSGRGGAEAVIEDRQERYEGI